MQLLKPIHLWFGLLGILLFLLTGQYMAHVLHVKDLADAPRMFMRASHIYLLLASVINLLLGVYITPPVKAQVLAWISSILFLLAPLLLAYGFFLEAPQASFDRPMTAFGLYFIFAGAALVVLQLMWNRITNRS